MLNSYNTSSSTESLTAASLRRPAPSAATCDGTSLPFSNQGIDGQDDGDLLRASKRAADTSVLLTNMVIGQPGSVRAMEAVARTNFLHAPYRRAGRILDDDMLYTLSLFTLEGMRWTDAYDYRRLTDMERCAMATFWKALGEDLEIPYDRLPSCSSRQGWADGLAWLEELDAWSRSYAEKKMAPSDSNAVLAASTMAMLLYRLPKLLKPVGRHLIGVLLGPKIREAMK